VAQRTIEIEENSFDVVWHVIMLLCLRDPVKVASSLIHGFLKIGSSRPWYTDCAERTELFRLLTEETVLSV
jgi:hypothetical protein